jgi:hypothetical protein
MAAKVYPVKWDQNKPPEANESTDLKVDEQQDKPGNKPDDTDPEKTAGNNQIAKNLLAQKNRKRKHGPVLELPFDPSFEEGSMWNLIGFSHNFDGLWLVHEVVFTITGKGGARMQVEVMDPASLRITTGTTPTPTKKTEILKNDNIGKESKPVPHNPGTTSSDSEWLDY